MKPKICTNPLEEQRRQVAYLDGLQAQVSALRAAQAETGKELSALMPSVLDRAFKGELRDELATKVVQFPTLPQLSIYY
jgi:hypothetical protein